ncbi:hypothetical protein [Cerasicoccus frondis]|uniref:hypothetical protein n=1 Tax=Cerasicoccus frondis TaxID=490090 RepID=UPI002852BE37|nr:hypothetical protein [Cerasicoccus frondis]
MSDDLEKDEALRLLREAMQHGDSLKFPEEQVEAALDKLGQIACHDTSGSQVARGMLCSMAEAANKIDGDEYQWSLLELKRFDYHYQRDAIMLIQWMMGPQWNPELVWAQIERFERV